MNHTTGESNKDESLYTSEPSMYTNQGEDFIEGKMEEFTKIMHAYYQNWDLIEKDEFFYQVGKTKAFFHSSLTEQMKQVVEAIPERENGSNVLQPYDEVEGWNYYRDKLLSNLKERGLIQ